MSFRISRLEINSPELKEFHKTCCRFLCKDIPFSYLNKGLCYGIYINGVLTSGYCIVSAPVLNLRAIYGIPDNTLRWLSLIDLDDAAELSVVITDTRGVGFLALHAIWKIFWHDARRFVYSYPAEQLDVKNVLAIGRPKCLYSGPTCGEDGLVSDNINERVEIITKTDIIRVIWKLVKDWYIGGKRHGVLLGWVSKAGRPSAGSADQEHQASGET